MRMSRSWLFPYIGPSIILRNARAITGPTGAFYAVGESADLRREFSVIAEKL
jgi:hypothetical protein